MSTSDIAPGLAPRGALATAHGHRKDRLRARKPRVLLVDDDEDLRALSAHALRRIDVEVHDGSTASWGRQATVLHPSDAIVLDVNLPDGNGIELCRALRATTECADTPIIVITARGDWDTVSLAYQAGATDFIAKPFAPEQLCQRVHHALQAQRVSARTTALQHRLDHVRSMGQLGHWELRRDGCLYASASLDQLLGAPSGEIDSVGALLERVCADARDALREAIDGALNGGRGGALQHAVQDSSGRVCEVLHSIDISTDEYGESPVVVGVVGRVGGGAADGDALVPPRNRRAAAYDPRTGLPAQRTTIDALDGYLGDIAAGADHSLAVVYARALSSDARSALGEAAVGAVGAPSFVGRFGHGVVVLLPAASLTSVASLAGELHGAAARNTGERPSMGVAFAGEDGHDAASLLAAAVAASRQVGAASPDRLAFASPALQTRALRRLLLPSAVRSARVGGHVRLLYSRIETRHGSGPTPFAVSLDAIGSGRLDGHPRLAIELLEADSARLDERVRICLRLTGASLAQADLVARLIRLARSLKASLELHLDALPGANIAAGPCSPLQSLRQAGVRIGLETDDPSMTELARLQEAGIDIICLASAATLALAAPATPAILLRALLAASHGLGLELLASGVDTAALLSRLRAAGVDALHGQWTGDPVTLADMTLANTAPNVARVR